MHSSVRAQWYPTLCDPIYCGQPLSMGSSRQEYWRELPFPTPGDLPNPGFEPASPLSSALVGRFFTTEPPGKPRLHLGTAQSPGSSHLQICHEFL